MNEYIWKNQVALPEINTMVFELKITILGTTVYNLYRMCELEDF